MSVSRVVYDFTMESSFRHPPHEQFLKGQTVIGETLSARSQGVSRGAHLLVNPREIGLLAMEETRDGVNQHGVGSSGVETAGFFEGQVGSTQ